MAQMIVKMVVKVLLWQYRLSSGDDDYRVSAADRSGSTSADGSCVVLRSAHVGGGSTDVSGGIQVVKVHPGIVGADVS